MNRPAPVEITYEGMRFLITHDPTNSQLPRFTEVRSLRYELQRIKKKRFSTTIWASVFVCITFLYLATWSGFNKWIPHRRQLALKEMYMKCVLNKNPKCESSIISWLMFIWILLGAEVFWGADTGSGVWSHLRQSTGGKRRHSSFGKNFPHTANMESLYTCFLSKVMSWDQTCPHLSTKQNWWDSNLNVYLLANILLHSLKNGILNRLKCIVYVCAHILYYCSLCTHILYIRSVEI